jgi:S1-C subfamily serine protease
MTITIIAAAALAFLTPTDSRAELKAVADRLHSIVVGVRAVAPVAVGAESSKEVLGTAMFGTGFLVGDGLIVTTLHTIGAALPGRMSAWSNIEALVPDQGQFAAEVVAWFPDVGLAVLRVPRTATPASVSFAADPPERGATLVMMGAAEDAVNAVGVTVAGVTGDFIFMASTRAVDSRYWGGPVLDTEGRLAGISLPSAVPRALTAPALERLLDRVRAR